MSEYIPPGAPAAGTTSIHPGRLGELSAVADREAGAIGEMAVLAGVAGVEDAVPRAELMSGCIAVRQTLEPMILSLFDELTQLSQKVRSGIATVSAADAVNASGFGVVNGR